MGRPPSGTDRFDSTEEVYTPEPGRNHFVSDDTPR